MKRFLALMLSAAVCLSLAACGGTNASTSDSGSSGESQSAEATPTGEKLKVGVCIYKFDDAFMTTYRNALQSMLEEKGYEVTVVDGNNDQAKQTEQINTFITQGMDALIINPVMTSAADSIIAAVKQADIPTVIINREPTAEQMAAYEKVVYVGCDDAQSGSFQGELILDSENKGENKRAGKVM